MPTLSENIQNRVNKLPKPSNYAQALQPVFEAISNAKFAIYDRFGAQALERGKIKIEVRAIRDAGKVSISVSDNGIGLDRARYEAFCTVDTDFKKEKGGKGVGRLFWLDAFRSIHVTSRYGDSESDIREFDFVLRKEDQVAEVEKPSVNFDGMGTSVEFRQVLDNEYSSYFPKKAETFFRYFSSHFISDFLMGVSPAIVVDVDGDVREYPSSIRELVVREDAPVAWTSDEFGDVSITGFLCDAEASTGFDGRNQVHLLADARTVETRKIDPLLGLGAIEAEGRDDLCLHVCVDAPFLDLRVNEGRTAFNLTEATIKRFVREVSEKIKETFLRQQIASYKISRAENYRSFIARYPIFDFDDPESQLDRIPFGANDPEEFAAGLVKIQIRREEDRYKQIQKIVDEIGSQDFDGANFASTVVKVAEEVQRSEELSLAQHVVRRKLILELLDLLLQRYRAVGDREDHYLEKTIHSVLCPTQVSTTDPSKLSSRRHDLWVVDERLTFTNAFSSDKRLDAVLKNSDSGLRPDLIVWDLAYGLAAVNDLNDEPDISQSINEMLVVELKKPMRENYKKFEDNIEQQIVKYVTQLKDGEIEGFNRDRIRVNKDCVFHCFVVADIVGDLTQQLSGWTRTPDGEGRYRPLEGDHRGSITVIQWKDLINDAWLRNQATLGAAGLRRTDKLISEMQKKLRDAAE